MPSSTITISGSSDDLIEIEGDAPGCDEYNGEAGKFLVRCRGDRTAVVTVRYGGVWAITVEQAGEDEPMPDVKLTAEGYTTKATIEDVLGVYRMELDS